MKILIVHVGTPVNPSKFDESEIYQENTLTHGRQYFRKYESVNNRQTRQSLVDAGLDVDHIYFTGRKNPYNCYKAALRIRKMVLQNKYDVVNQYWGGLASFFVSIMCPTIYIISLLGSDLYGQYKPDGSKTWMGKLLSFFSQLTCLYANGIIVMSEKMKNKLWASSRKKVAVICEGIDLEKFYLIDRSKAREHLGWDQGRPVVLFFPSEAYVKNTPLAKAAFDRIKDRLPGAELRLVHGVPHADLVWYYNAADLLLLTSYHEGSNNSIKEALACNLPVVSVDVGDANERLINVKPSIVVKHFDADEIADAMVSILKEGRRSNGRDMVFEVELPYLAKRIGSFYERLLNESKG